MGIIKKFEDLEVWKKARTLAVDIHNLTFKEPLSKDFRLKDQMRGSSGLIIYNIAEGFAESADLNL